MKTIAIENIIVPTHQRATRPWQVKTIATKMKQQGYNESYPITIDTNRKLVDGGHRVAAAKLIGLTELPYIEKDNGLSNIQHSIRCNADGADTLEHDVFDYAELCWAMAKQKWSGKQIADELEWRDPATVTRYKNIKTLSHGFAWNLARYGLTKNPDLSIDMNLAPVNPELTIVNWTESHFRALLKHLPCDKETGNRALMRGQLKAIHAIIARHGQPDKRFGKTQKTVTAAWIETLAEKIRWHTDLALHMRDNLVLKVPMRDRINLLNAVYQGVFGNKRTDKNWDKFDEAVKKLNEHALGITLYHDDALQRIPLLDDSSIDLVVTDPPYNVTEYEWDQVGTDEEYIEFTREWLTRLQPKLASDFHLFIFCDPHYQARIEELLKKEGWPLLSRVIWWSRSLPSGRGQISGGFSQTWQMVFHCGNHPLNWPPQWDDRRFDVQVFSAPNANTKDGGYHPTSKPVALLEHFIRLGSKPTNTILDMFAGGGATGEACGNVGQRKCILIEKNDGFNKTIEDRLKIRREIAYVRHHVHPD